MPDLQAYSNYLRGRGRAGLLYRTLFLYPRLARHLNGRVLDYGCGIGDFVRYRANTVGVDVNEHNVDHCRKQGLDARLIDDNQLPFTDGSFDGVVLDNVLEHIPGDRVDKVLGEIARVMKESGKIVVGVPGIKGFECDPDHKIFYTKESLITLFEQHGFRPMKVFFMPLAFQGLGRVLSQFCVYAVFTRRKAPHGA